MPRKRCCCCKTPDCQVIISRTLPAPNWIAAWFSDEPAATANVFINTVQVINNGPSSGNFPGTGFPTTIRAEITNACGTSTCECTYFPVPPVAGPCQVATGFPEDSVIESPQVVVANVPPQRVVISNLAGPLAALNGEYFIPCNPNPTPVEITLNTVQFDDGSFPYRYVCARAYAFNDPTSFSVGLESRHSITTAPGNFCSGSSGSGTGRESNKVLTCGRTRQYIYAKLNTCTVCGPTNISPECRRYVSGYNSPTCNVSSLVATGVGPNQASDAILST